MIIDDRTLRENSEMEKVQRHRLTNRFNPWEQISSNDKSYDEMFENRNKTFNSLPKTKKDNQ